MALPSQIDPRKLALKGALLEGHIDSADLARLSSAVNRVVSPLSVSIQFEVDETGQSFAKGVASVEVELTCQRCLDPFKSNLQASFSLQIIWSEDQIANVSPEHEPWVVVDRIADPIAMVEDEVLLGLPFVSYHKVGECTGSALKPAGSDSGELAAAKSPFSILEQLKK
jgi:uncharacterized protein